MAEQGLVSKTLLTNIANAIRSKTGETAKYKPGDMANAIGRINGGKVTFPLSQSFPMIKIMHSSRGDAGDGWHVEIPSGTTRLILQVPIYKSGTESNGAAIWQKMADNVVIDVTGLMAIEIEGAYYSGNGGVVSVTTATPAFTGLNKQGIASSLSLNLSPWGNEIKTPIVVKEFDFSSLYSYVVPKEYLTNSHALPVTFSQDNSLIPRVYWNCNWDLSSSNMQDWTVRRCSYIAPLRNGG